MATSVSGIALSRTCYQAGRTRAQPLTWAVCVLGRANNQFRCAVSNHGACFALADSYGVGRCRCEFSRLTQCNEVRYGAVRCSSVKVGKQTET